MNRFMNGWVNGFIGVAIFAGSLPATRVAVMGFEPGFLTAARAAIAGILGLILILVLKQKKPAKQDWWPLAIVALGVVIGFPLFTALALQYMNAAHSIVFVSLLPLATAIFAVLRGGENSNQFFWIFAILGSAVVFAYMFFISGDTSLGIGRLLYVNGDYFMWFWLCRRRCTFKKNRGVAGHLLGANFVTTFYAVSDYFLYASFISERIYISFGRPYLCVFI